ncbi:MAG: sulfite exporter TauE/SafE family protein [Candidatus Dormibacteraeota bacterium]|uniref:Probable membrane transporter protein n=1 Tax=Candidatus Aeolococcus gillhamiae TaxID=3127015 RepID=A0A934N754_9BACT|nr:sulfite exporter TauE/SafE family protein [Candidatus Dormibacteraeota bacterium]
MILVALGAAVGVFGTLVGAGGGFILTPILLLIYPRDTAATITAISLVVVFFNALSGSAAYARQRRIDYRAGIAFALATLPGAVAGALLVGAAPRRLFDAVMACLLGGLAIWLISGGARDDRAGHGPTGTPRLLTDRDGTTYRYSVRTRRGVAYSVGVGFISSFLGIGGGVIHVPLLVRALGFPVHVATATSHFVLANMAAVGTVTHIAAGSFAGGTGIHRAIALSLGVVGGAQVGAWLSQRAGSVIIQRLLAVALAALAVRLLVTVL